MADRIVASAETIRKAVARVSPAYVRKTTIPILGCAMLAYGDGAASLTTTDLEMQITSSFDAEVEGIGRVVIPFYALRWIAGMIGDVTFEIIEPKNKTPPKLVASDTSGAKLSINLLYPQEDFPMMLVGDGFASPMQISQAEVMRVLTFTRHAVSTEEARYYLNGVYLHGFEGKLRAVATDGHRMAIIDTEIGWPEDATGDRWPKREAWMPKNHLGPKEQITQGLIVPTDTVAAILGAIDKRGNEPVMVKIAPTRLVVESSGWSITAKVIDGTYPNYERVIPRAETRAVFNIDEASFRHIRPIWGGQSGMAVRIDLAAKTMTARAPDAECEISAPLASVQVDVVPFTIGFNGRYIREGVKAIGGVGRFEVVNPIEPVKVRGEDPSMLMILMPMRV